MKVRDPIRRLEADGWPHRFASDSSPWGAYLPDLPGVISVADSREEVALRIQEAIEFHLDGMREEGPSSFAGAVEINVAA